VNQTFNLFDKLGATEAQLDFPVVYASALQGWAATDLSGVAVSTNPALRRLDMKPLLDTILERVPAPADNDVDGTLQLQLHALDYSSYVGRIGVGKLRRGRLLPGQEVAVLLGERALGKAKVNQVLGFQGLERVPLAAALAGDIVLVTGIDELAIGATIADADRPEGLPPLKVDEPTLTMQFVVNTSPFAGTEGKYVTSRNLRERLQREVLTNMALRVEETADTDVFVVHGRGELHLTILVENMRREGYELAVGRPKVITRTIDGVTTEPYEALTVDLEDAHQGAAMEALGGRRAELSDMQPDGRGRVRLDYRIPARGLIGFQNEFMNLTRGTGVMTHVFDEYGPVKGEVPGRRNGVLVSQETGEAVAFALFNLQERGRLFVSPGEKIYEGMVVGIHSRDNDLTVNPLKGKKLTNVRAAGKDDNVLLTPPVQLTLEYAVEFIADDELVEVTPQSIRIRKRFLKAHQRKRGERAAGAEA
jgi:GTP-binding protein